MKFYKIEDNKFKGFYDKEINEGDIFDLTHKEEKREIEEIKTDKEGNEHKEVKTEIVQVPIYTLKEGFYEISEEKWQALLDGQSQGKEIKILKDGTLGLYEKPVYTGTDFVKPVWDEESETWTEGASVDEVYDARELKVLEIMNLSEKIERLEKAAKISPILASPKTIERRKKDMAKLEKEVIELTALIEKLEN